MTSSFFFFSFVSNTFIETKRTNCGFQTTLKGGHLKHENNLMDQCIAINEACSIIQEFLGEGQGLTVEDFFRSSIVRTSCKPHELRVELFRRAHVTEDDLVLFEHLCLEWVRNNRRSFATVYASVIELQREGQTGLFTLTPVTRCFAVEAAINRVFFARKGIQFLKLYRGLHKLPSDCFSQGSKQTLSIQHSVCESQTTSLFVARTFGPVIIQGTVPVTQILMCHKTNTVFLPHENEYVVVTGSANNPSEHYSQTNKSIARRLFLFNARIYQSPQERLPNGQKHHKHRLFAWKS